MRDYVMDTFLLEKIGVNPLRGFVSLFWFFQSLTAETPTWILTFNTSNYAVPRKEEPFRVKKVKLYIVLNFGGKFKKRYHCFTGEIFKLP